MKSSVIVSQKIVGVAWWSAVSVGLTVEPAACCNRLTVDF
jgi:hypothetical protein